MANDSYFPRLFKCKKKKCGNTEKRYKWLSDKSDEICHCGSKMVEVVTNKVEAPVYGRISSMTPNQRQQVLKARSHQHFEKVIKERKHEMTKAFMRNEKKKFSR